MFVLKRRVDNANCNLVTGPKMNIPGHTHISSSEDVDRTVSEPAAVVEAVLLGWLYGDPHLPLQYKHHH